MPTVCSPYKIMTREVADCQRMCYLRLRFNLLNYQNYLKSFSKLVAVLNNLKTVASSGTTLSDNREIGTSCDTGQYAAH